MKIFDAHLHIIDPDYPLIENQGYLPPAFRAADYLNQTKQLDLELLGGVVVSGSFQGFDQTYLESALKTLGPNFVGVTQIPHTTPDSEILRLNALGVRGLRFNIQRGGSEKSEKLIELGSRVADLADWHIELYVDSTALPALVPALKQFKRYSIDHLGLNKDGLPHLYKAAENGATIKATGFGRLNFDPVPVIRELMRINPDAVMFGTDLPSTRAPIPYSKSDAELCIEAFEEDACKRLFFQNALQFYRMDLTRPQ